MRIIFLAGIVLGLATAPAAGQSFGVTGDTDVDALNPMQIGQDLRLMVEPPQPHELLPAYAVDIGYDRTICTITGISHALSHIRASELQINLAEILDGIYGERSLVPRAQRMLANATYELLWDSPSEQLHSINLAVAPAGSGPDYHVFLRYTFPNPVECLSRLAPSSRGL